MLAIAFILKHNDSENESFMPLMTSEEKNVHAAAVTLSKRAAELRTPTERTELARYAAFVRWQRYRLANQSELK